MESTGTIHERIAAIIADLPGIGKDSRMQGGGQSYSYRGIDDIMPHIKTLFSKHGVHTAPTFTVVSDETYSVEKNGRTTRWRHVTLSGAFTFYASDGSSFTATTIGEGKDSADKAFNKAMTASLKYALIQTLAIADGDDPDAYYPDEVPEPRPRVVSTKPQAEAAEPTSLQKLIGIRDDLKAAGLYEQVVAHAADQGVDLLPGTPDAQVAVVYEFAVSLLGQ
jgi:hypothetical protein